MIEPQRLAGWVSIQDETAPSRRTLLVWFKYKNEPRDQGSWRIDCLDANAQWMETRNANEYVTHWMEVYPPTQESKDDTNGH